MSVPVIDASVAIAWLLEGESNARAGAAYTIVEIGGGLITQYWDYRVRNSLLRAERRSRATASQIDMHLFRIIEISDHLHIDTEPNFDAAFSLARVHGMSFYDATYLELALRQGAALATLDNAIARAAAVEGLPNMI